MAKKIRAPINEMQELLHNWSKMLDATKTLSENEIWKLLDYEVKHRARLSFVLRLYGVVSNVRYQRERKELLATLSRAK